MKDSLVELISKISSGCMGEDEIVQIADDAAQAYADPQAFLAANHHPLAQRDREAVVIIDVRVGSLPETVLFQADSYMDLFEQIVQSFGKEVTFNIKPKQLAKVEPLVAVNRIQIQLSSMNKEMGGYVLMNFSQPLDDELQAVLVYGCDEARVIELAASAGIYAAPALQALRG